MGMESKESIVMDDDNKISLEEVRYGHGDLLILYIPNEQAV